MPFEICDLLLMHKRSMARITPKWLLMLLGAIAPMAVGATNVGEQSDRSPAVTVAVNRTKARLRVKVDGAPLPVVLDVVTRATGTKLNHGPLPSAPMSVVCEQAGLQRVLECLLGADAHIAIRHAPGGENAGPVAGFPEEIWVVHAGADPNIDGAETWSSNEMSGSGVDSKVPLSEREKDRESVARGTALAASTDPGRRAQGIQELASLGHRDDPNIRNQLERALTDSDAGTRSQAVFGLGRYGDSESAAVLLQALRDEDIDVRLIAVETAGRDPEGLAVLREAMRDQDQDVSTLAATKLELFGNPAGIP